MSCSPALIYSVCKPDISETSKSEPVYAVFAIISSEHTQQRIWKKLATFAHCRVLFVAVRIFFTNSLYSWWISAYFFLPFTCCGIIFLYLKWPANTWITQQRKDFHSCLISGFERGVNEICALLGFYAASIGSFLPTLRDNRWCLWNSHSGVGENSSHLGVLPRQLVNSPSSQGQPSKMKALLSTETSVTLHKSTGRNLHQHLRENVTSSRIEKTVPVRVTMYGASLTDLWISFRALWYIKTLVDINKCTILQSVYSFCYM